MFPAAVPPPVAPATPAPVTPTPAPVAPATPPARTRRNNWLWIILGIVALLALCLLCSTITGLSYWWMTRAAPAPATETPYYPPALPTPYVAPVPTAPAAPVACSPLSIAEFNQMWSSTPVDNPGPLMEALNTWFDTGGWQCGGQSSVGDWKVPAGTILWTDLLNQQFVVADGTALRDGDVVRLRCQGNWCVYAVYREVISPTPGRYAILERWLNPALDLSGW